MTTRADLINRIFTLTLAERLPGYEAREPQLQAAQLVNQALLEDCVALIEAGTGTGKSLANLIPAVIHAKERHEPVIVSTGTIALQEQYMGKDIPFLQQTLGLDFQAYLAKGKGNYLCVLREGETTLAYTREEERWLQNTTTGDRSEAPASLAAMDRWQEINVNDDCVGQKCPLYDCCLYYKAKRQLDEADIIVTNHHLLMADMALRAQTAGVVSILPEAAGLICDEGHHLEDVARDAIGAKVTRYRLPMLLNRIGRHVPGIAVQQAVSDARAKHARFFEDIFNNLVGKPGTGHIPHFWKGFAAPLLLSCSQLANAVRAAAKAIADEAEAGRATAFADQLKHYTDDLEAVVEPNQNNQWVAWYEANQETGQARITLRLTPVSVAGALKQHLFGAYPSVVLTSATLTAGGSFSYLKSQLGISEALELRVASPFNYQKQALLYIPRDEAPDPKDLDYYERLAPLIEDILLRTDGRAFVLFCSYRGMEIVWRALSSRLRWTVLKQGQMPNQQLIEAFRRDTHSVLFGTSSFWEGVDIQGESLSCVIIDKLPFPTVGDPVVMAKETWIKSQGGNPFRDFQMPVAALKLQQAFGRLIRTKEDRGLVAILDRRIRTKPYGRYFLDSLPDATWIKSLENVQLFLKEGAA